MTTPRIRWCVSCNLISASRRCPNCRKDVSNIHIDGKSEICPIFKNEAARIRSAVDSMYGEGCGELLIPDERTALYIRNSGNRKILINGGIVGSVSQSGDVSLNASGLGIISEKISKNTVQCDHDSSFFVSKGRNLMASGVKSHSDGLKAGDIVAVFDDRGRPIAEGVMRMSSDELRSSDRGVAVKIKSNDTSRAEMNSRCNDWNSTLEENRKSIDAFSGDSSKKISDVVSSYGYPVIVSMSSDIVSEAGLLLTLDAGYRPKVLLREKNDFLDYLLQKHGLDTVADMPERCVLITDVHMKSDTDVIVHSPTTDWDPAMVWMYVLSKAEPFDPSYLQGRP